MSRPRLLDLFCGAGGAAMGYHRAGFEVVGVDINPQPNYPFEFYQGDALKYLLEHFNEFDAYHASPPCQAFTNAQRIMHREHPDYITATRAAFGLMQTVGCRNCQQRWAYHRPWVIENVEGAPLRPDLVLCGAMFGLGTYRHRVFESSHRMPPLDHPEHMHRLAKMGRRPEPGEFMHVVGHFSGVNEARAAMGINWMTRDELSESIPPAYTEYIGQQLMAYLSKGAAA